MAIKINIGKNIKKYCVRQSLPRKDFIKKSDIKYTTFTEIESNVIKNPSVLVMAQIAETLAYQRRI